jgi:8-oxo-dGTP diphosphatase
MQDLSDSLALEAFSGAKIALTLEGAVLTCLRDNRPDIPFSGFWDLPGGGREGAETPVACALRELEEEFGFSIAPEEIVWARANPRYSGEPLWDWFFAAPLRERLVAAIRFGAEGQAWRLTPVEEFLADPMAIPHLKARLRDSLTLRDSLMGGA